LGRPANWRESLTPRDAKRRGTKAPTPKERGDGGDRRDCYWLYVVTDCDSTPRPHIIRDPAGLAWHEVKKVDHYWLSVDTMQDRIKVREQSPPYFG